MAADERNREMPHTVILEGREKLSISGVVDVQSFDEDQVLLETVRGMLVVRGQGLHVERLQLEAGELIVEGEVGCLEYDDSVQPRGGFFSRLFGGGTRHDGTDAGTVPAGAAKYFTGRVPGAFL